MASTLGTVLPRKSVAWFWFAVAAVFAGYFAFRAITKSESWALPFVFGTLAALVYFEPRLRRPERETIQVDDEGVLRVDGDIREQVKWTDIEEIRIITTDQGPYQEDVFFVLATANATACLIPHDAAVRTQLLEELQSRFPGLDDKMVIQAMGSTSNNSFPVWRSAGKNAA